MVSIAVMIVSITLPIFLGYFFKKLNMFNQDEVKTLRKFVIKVTVPFIIFKNLYQADTETLTQIFPQSFGFILVSVLFSLTAYYFAKLFIKDQESCNSYIFAVFIGNYGYLGWGVMDYFYGSAGFTRSVFFTLLFWPVFLFTGFSLIYFRNRSSFPLNDVLKMIYKHSLLPISTTILAIVVNLLDVSFHPVIKEFIAKISGITIPMILFTVGLNFKFRMHPGNFLIVLSGAFHRLIIGFGLGFFSYLIVNFCYPLDAISAKVIILEATMPTAAMATLFTEFIRVKKELHSAIITYSTLFCLVTIPFWYYLLEKIF